MLPPSSLQHTAHKFHSSAWPPERPRVVRAAKTNQKAISQGGHAVFIANTESGSLLLKSHASAHLQEAEPMWLFVILPFYVYGWCKGCQNII